VSFAAALRWTGAPAKKASAAWCGMVMSSAFPHGESPLSGLRGRHDLPVLLQLRCVYCQNYQISHAPAGVRSPRRPCGIMLELQALAATTSNP